MYGQVTMVDWGARYSVERKELTVEEPYVCNILTG